MEHKKISETELHRARTWLSVDTCIMQCIVNRKNPYTAGHTLISVY